MTISKGYLVSGDNQNLNSMAYFNGLRYLLRAARHISNRKIADCNQGKQEGVSKYAKLEFEGLPLIQRRALIEELAAILKNGSGGIAPYLKQHGVIFSQVEVSGEDQPYWLSQALLPLKRSQHPERSDTEVSAIANAVQLREGTFSISSARELFGVHLTSQKVPQYLRSDVSDETYETLMTALDHHVASTFDAKTRFALLQDKVLFGLLRLTQHSSEIREIGAMDRANSDRSDPPILPEVTIFVAGKTRAAVHQPWLLSSSMVNRKRDDPMGFTSHINCFSQIALKSLQRGPPELLFSRRRGNHHRLG
jgi:hypothetical protein